MPQLKGRLLTMEKIGIPTKHCPQETHFTYENTNGTNVKNC
jgi:hypothetical protein